MIELVKGDILKADAQALVNTVNCVGVMGRGIALQFKKKFPDNFKVYKKACDIGELKLGSVLVHDMDQLYNPRYIINFPTKNHWRAKSRIEDIDAGLDALIEEVKGRHIASIAIPPLGCGLGGLNWQDVKPLIIKWFSAVPEVRVLLYEPAGAPVPAKMPRASRAPNMTVGRAAMIGLMRQYLSAVMDPFVTLLEIHKLMYFLKVVGEPMDKLRFVKGPYGPYSETLRHVLNETEGYLTAGFGDGEDAPSKPIELVAGASERAEQFLVGHEDTRNRFNKVAELISGFETPYGMELLATVHWVNDRESASTPEQALEKVYEWNEHKRMFPESHIRLAWGVLEREGLMRPSVSSDSAT